MSGIYIHIPFCKQKCIYCNFHSSASLRQKDAFIAALVEEVVLRKDYLSGVVETLYVGGGTPSLLDGEDYQRIFDVLDRCFDLSKLTEVTIEANPEDLTGDKITALRALPFNRLSIGVQSLNRDMLHYLGRIHDPEKTKKAVLQVQQEWTENISVDLIYGIPGMTDELWLKTIDEVLAMGVPHISCYALTVEPSTSLPKLIERGRKQAPVEGDVLRQMDLLVETLSAAGYRQYEISNFSVPGKEAIHNANYWQQKPYVGFGPSAHSFNGSSRQWNVANNVQYIRSLSAGKCNFEKEMLSKIDCFNEYLMTGLRTIGGLDGAYIKELYGDVFFEHFIRSAANFLKNGWMEEMGCRYRLSQEGLKVSDYIISELFITE